MGARGYHELNAKAIESEILSRLQQLQVSSGVPLSEVVAPRRLTKSKAKSGGQPKQEEKLVKKKKRKVKK